MARPSPPPLVAVGVNHRSASVALRDRLFVAEEEVAPTLAGLRHAGIEEALVLATCDRVEVHAIAADPGVAAAAILERLAARAGTSPDALSANAYVLVGAEAARHLFAVTAAIDSLVVGEPYVLGQVKAAHRLARAAGMVGGELDRLLDAAYAGAKRVRRETRIGERPVSVAAAAVRVARDIHGDLGACVGLLLGVAEMGELVARQFREAGLGRLAVAHRLAARAAALARALDANTLGVEALDETVAGADIVLSAVGLGGYALTAGVLEAALVRRRQRPLFVVDLAVPRDVEPAAERLDGVFLYDIDDLEGLAAAGRSERESELAAARGIVEETLSAYLEGRAMRGAAPLIGALRGRFEAERARALGEAPDDAAEATRLLVNRLLHAPSTTLRRMAAEGTDAERLLRRLFGLDEEDDP